MAETLAVIGAASIIALILRYGRRAVRLLVWIAGALALWLALAAVILALWG